MIEIWSKIVVSASVCVRSFETKYRHFNYMHCHWYEFISYIRSVAFITWAHFEYLVSLPISSSSLAWNFDFTISGTVIFYFFSTIIISFQLSFLFLIISTQSILLWTKPKFMLNTASLLLCYISLNCYVTFLSSQRTKTPSMGGLQGLNLFFQTHSPEIG